METSHYAAIYNETAEEWPIHDFDLLGMERSESKDIYVLCEQAEALEEHGEVLVAYLDSLGTCDPEGFEEAYCGAYNSELDYVYELVEELMPHDTPDFLTRYFDYESFSRDFFISDYYSCRVSAGWLYFGISEGGTNRTKNFQMVINLYQICTIMLYLMPKQ